MLKAHSKDGQSIERNISHFKKILKSSGNESDDSDDSDDYQNNETEQKARNTQQKARKYNSQCVIEIQMSVHDKLSQDCTESTSLPYLLYCLYNMELFININFKCILPIT